MKNNPATMEEHTTTNRRCAQHKRKNPNSSTRAKRIMLSFFSDQETKLSPINFFENTMPRPANENPE
jgi:hypothetical protein